LILFVYLIWFPHRRILLALKALIALYLNLLLATLVISAVLFVWWVHGRFFADIRFLDTLKAFLLFILLAFVILVISFAISQAVYVDR